ncbi:MAG: hypothetical protein WB992_23830 [Bryobacteraceae bacterium]
MGAFFRTSLLALLCAATACLAADVPQQRLQSAIVREKGQSPYYWSATSVGTTAQLVTLVCRSCLRDQDVPLVAVLRDTLGDHDPENNRVSYVWLLSYSRLSIEQRMLSAVPFFYWRAGKGSQAVSVHDTAPLFDLTAPIHPVLSEAGRDILQWTMLDPMTTPVRATSRAYRTNETDHERLHLEEAIGYLREAPVSEDESALTRAQLDTVIARLELRKRLLGGLVSERRAAQLGEEWNFEQERIRSRNWELLRQCAEKTGLIFEPLDVSGTTGQYAIIWFPLQHPPEASGTSVSPIWKLLNIKNPWTDTRLADWHGRTYNRALDENGSLLPVGAAGAAQARLVPLAVYGLSYPKMPLLLVDFRDKLHAREHEMTQRTINEITSGVIGISHFTNWYYYVAADLYDFVKSRHGGPMDQAARLDSYSQFRVALALDNRLESELRKEMQRRVDSLAVNPLEASPEREMQAAIERYALLKTEAEDGGKLIERLDKTRRSELAAFGETKKAKIGEALLHDASFGLYTHRAKQDPANLEALDRYRRIQYHLAFLDSLVEAGTQPEITYDSSRIQSSVMALSALMTDVNSAETRAHAEATLLRLQELSQDGLLQADCSVAVASLRAASAREPAVPASASVAANGAETLR